MYRWSHGHSAGAGALILALAATHTIWLLTVTFALGLLVGSSWRGLKRGVHATGHLLAARVATEKERRNVLRAVRRDKLEKSKALRDRLEQAYRRGVIEGRLDGKREAW